MIYKYHIQIYQYLYPYLQREYQKEKEKKELEKKKKEKREKQLEQWNLSYNKMKDHILEILNLPKDFLYKVGVSYGVLRNNYPLA
jgi:hypothetical protein